MECPSVSSTAESGSQKYRVLLFIGVTVVCGVLTVRAVVRGQHRIQVLLLGILTAYALSISLAKWAQIPHFERLAALPLGVFGAVAYVVGVPTDLPILFILLSIGALVDLVWDPTGNVHS